MRHVTAKPTPKMLAALRNLAEGRDWHVGLAPLCGPNAQSVWGGLASVMPGLYRRGLVERDDEGGWKLTEEGRRVAAT